MKNSEQHLSGRRQRRRGRFANSWLDRLAGDADIGTALDGGASTTDMERRFMAECERQSDTVWQHGYVDERVAAYYAQIVSARLFRYLTEPTGLSVGEPPPAATGMMIYRLLKDDTPCRFLVDSQHRTEVGKTTLLGLQTATAAPVFVLSVQVTRVQLENLGGTPWAPAALLRAIDFVIPVNADFEIVLRLRSPEEAFILYAPSRNSCGSSRAPARLGLTTRLVSDTNKGEPGNGQRTDNSRRD